MSVNGDRKTRSVTLKMDGEGRATATIAFIDRGDLDKDAFAPGALADAVVPVGRAHELILGGDRPPFGVARVTKQVDRHVAEITFLKTRRGIEEHATAKALHEAGVRQPVSIGFHIEATGPVPEHLRPTVVRHITKARLVELSFVGLGAIPGAELNTVKARTDRIDLTLDVKRFERRELFRKCLEEPRGAVVWNAAQDGARWLTKGVLQEGPAVCWFNDDGRRNGYFDPRRPDRIYVSRGLKTETDVIRTAMHETSHWWHIWDPSEGPARFDAEWLTDRYLEKLGALWREVG